MGRLFLLQDITTHKELAEDLRKTRDQLAARLAELEQAQAALLRRERLSTLGQTVATVSHEMRNPLATVRNALFSLREALGTGDRARSARAIELAERNIRRCDAIIMELVEYSRSRPPVLEDTDVDHWLGQVLDELDTPKGIEVTRTLCSRVRTRMDPERMRRAVINIHANAVQAMSTEDARGGTLAVESSSHDGKVEMAFRDNGTGMSSEVLAKAGEPLYSTKPYGVGLGLSIVKEVMREHGGSLRIDSSEGKGTVVTLELRALP
jgi:signal transduction histidine kinase